MNRTGMTSVTFRKLNIREIVDISAQSGIHGIEWGGDLHVRDLVAAKEAGQLTREAGLEVFSYGSYYSPERYEDYTGEFERLADIAGELGCKVVRTWAGEMNKHPFSEADEGFLELFCKRMRDIADIAKKREIKLCFEHHQGSLCDHYESAYYTLKRIGKENVRTYWQPILSYDENLMGIIKLMPFIENIHVYHWKNGARLPLNEGRDVWAEYIRLLKTGGDRNFILEFVKDDDPAQFIEDARILKELIDESN